MNTDLKPYPSMKNSGVPWLDKIPGHWEMYPNRALIRKRKILVGVRHSEYKLLSLTKQGIIVRDIESGKGKFSADMGTSQEVRSGDLVFCLFDIPETPRTVGLSHYDGMITGAYTVFECPDYHLAKYLDLFYRAMDDRKLLGSLYSGLRNTISPARFLGIKTPVPPKDEQSAIVRFLDHANRRIAYAIQAKQNLIALLNEQKWAIIQRAVTRGLDPNAPLKPSGIPWLGDIPQHWEPKPNRSFLKLRKQVVGDYHREFTLLSLTLRGVIARDMENPTGKWPTDFATYQIVESGDLVFCLFDIDETPRCVGLSELRGMITSAYTVFQCTDGDLVKFLFFFYLAMDHQKCLKPAYTGLRKVIQKGTFLGIKTPIPPAPERERILANIQTESTRIDTAVTRLEREIDLIHEYRTRLVADVVTGKLDVREAASKLPLEEESEPPANEEFVEEKELEPVTTKEV